MKGLSIEKVKKLEITRRNFLYKPRLNLKDTRKYKLYSKLKSAGYFNGKILGCVDYKIRNGRLLLKCIKINFFDFLHNRIGNHRIPKLVNVNAIIQISDNFVFIKRDNKVHSYKGYYDFPAGLVFYNEEPLEKLKYKIKEDAGINNEMIKNIKLIAGGVSARYLCLFYIVKCKLAKDGLREISKSSKYKIKLVKKRNIRSFIDNNKFVYPEILKEIH